MGLSFLSMDVFLVIFLASFLLLWDGSISFAEENSSIPASPQKNLMSGLLSNDYILRNPFKSQLPLPQIPRIKRDAEIPPSIRVGPGPRDQEVDSSQKIVLIESPTLKISGLLWGTEQPQAIVNNKIVRVGDQVEGWTITVINEKGIEISAQGRKQFIVNDFNRSDPKER